MLQKIRKKTLLRSVQMLCVLSAALLVWGCGGGGGGGDSDSYDTKSILSTTPIEGQTQNILIDAPTLKSWVDKGYVNNSSDYSKPSVVIIDRAASHIPGAQKWGAVGVERYEGPILSGNMVLDGATMDAAMQAFGVTEDTTIVFSDGAQRVYFLFMYWGFPADQLKVLNGGNAAWAAYGYDELTSEVPDVEPSDLCVSSLGGVRDELRASLSEAIVGVRDAELTPYITYSNTSNVTAETIKETIRDSSRYVIFQGIMDGAVEDNFVLGLSKLANINGTDVSVYLDADEMEEFLEVGLGVDLAKPIMTYCRAGNLASMGFTPLYAVLGNEVDIMMYDGSWSQWGSLTLQTEPPYVPGPQFALPQGYEDWATEGLTNPIYYNYNSTTLLSEPDFDTTGVPYSPEDAGANTIEIEDEQYYENAQSSDDGGAPVAGGGIDGGC